MHSFYEKSRQRRKKYTVQRVICCSGGLYAVQEGYMDAQEGHALFSGVLCCSGGLGLYAVQEDYIDVQEGCILKWGYIHVIPCGE